MSSQSKHKTISRRYIALLFVFLSLQCYAQYFEGVQALIGLEGLEDNNGVAVADYDNDNDLDVFVVAQAKDGATYKSLSRLLRNNNDGTFTDVTQDAGFQNLFSQSEGGEGSNALAGFKYGASWGDFNNDGYPDLFLTYFGKIQLWKNLGDGTFSNITNSAGFMSSNGCINTTATWFDYNNDGLLDIYVPDWSFCTSNSLFKNNGDETFSNVTLLTNIISDLNHASYLPMPFDFNADGFMDLYVTNDKAFANKLYINNNGESFTEQGSDYGLALTNNDMGLAIGDYNNDGLFDFFITAINLNVLMTNNGDTTFTDYANVMGVGNTLWSWGTRFLDFDLDGDEDLFVTNGFMDAGIQSNFFFTNEYPSSYFQNVSVQYGLNDIGMSVDVNDFDYDNDGDIDLLVSSSDGPLRCYENVILNFDDENPSSNWLKIQLEGTTSNRDAIGATVSITTENRSLVRYHSGMGFLSQSLKPLHFGLHQDVNILEVEIRWPSGLIETYENLNVNSNLKANEGQGIEVLNILPSQKTYGCTDPNSCNYNPNATIDDNSCVYLETNSISGPIDVQLLSEHQYSYNLGNANTSLFWQVEGGEIISGQGTNQITVKWHIGPTGNISITESDASCQSMPSTLEVTLSADDLPSHISVARLWNEALLEAIRNDYARPTVHARNLFHSSVAMYDIWAIHHDAATPYLIGKTIHGFSSTLDNFVPNNSIDLSIDKAISYAMYRLIIHRFENSPGFTDTLEQLQFIMNQLGYDTSITTTNYQTGSAADLGNYIAQIIINYGLQDGAREQTGYDNAYYQPINSPLLLEQEMTSSVENPNRWQPLSFDVFIDQSGNTIVGSTPDFLSPEWGNVNGFSLSNEDQVSYSRDGNDYRVYHDPLDPPYIAETGYFDINDFYKWGFLMVSVWQSHLDPDDGVLWDISPAAIGNISSLDFPSSFEDYSSFYDFFNGGTLSNPGHEINPYTNEPYAPNMVPRGDYARVLAEFWADGPDSETPPGHWFTILNHVNDHPLLEKRFQGEGPILDPLQWDVKAYFILGAGMHDAAVSAWSVKGWYDYIRPISALRYMAFNGQSSDPSLDNYHDHGLPLIPNFVEVVQENDPLAGPNNENVGEVKLFTWKGHSSIDNPNTDVAGVGWILAKNWYPYQRPTFVTPPFAGFVSGHSTFSRAAADLLTAITGNSFFPGGMGEFVARQNEFLVFEEGPSQDIVLQWATYQDASDQTSLSRIWGGIHPPFDDILGRKIGERIADDVFNQALTYFESTMSLNASEYNIVYHPNPVISYLDLSTNQNIDNVIVTNAMGQNLQEIFPNSNNYRLDMSHFVSGVYFVTVSSEKSRTTLKVIKQ